MRSPSISLVCLCLLVGCGGGSSNPIPLADGGSNAGQPSGEYNPDGRVVNACEAPYFSELTGRYGAPNLFSDNIHRIWTDFFWAGQSKSMRRC